VQVTEGDGYCLGRVLINAQTAVPLASAVQSRASNRQPFAVAFSAGGGGGRKSPELPAQRTQLPNKALPGADALWAVRA
jgi:hypothetical protein